MTLETLKLKFGKAEYEVSVDPSTESVNDLKAKIYTLTRVPVDKQKLLFAGTGALKDSDSLVAKFAKKPVKATLIGTAEGNELADATSLLMAGNKMDVGTTALSPTAARKAAVAAGLVEPLPLGIQNFGNTCYLNSVLQFLRFGVVEFVEWTKSAPRLKEGISAGDRRLALAFVEVMKSMDPKKVDASKAAATSSAADLEEDGAAIHHRVVDNLPLIAFLVALRQRYPQFDEVDKRGGHAQQDAEELLRSIFNTLAQCFETDYSPVEPKSPKSPKSPATKKHAGSSSSGDDNDSFVDRLFGFSLKTQLVKAKTPSSSNSSSSSSASSGSNGNHTAMVVESDEAVNETSEHLRVLPCHLGDQLQPVSHLHDGVKLALHGTVEKADGMFDKISFISSLPKYVVVQFCRFQWKKKSDTAGTEATKTKITRKCKFPFRVDFYDFCTKDLQSQLRLGRKKEILIRDRTGASEEALAQDAAELALLPKEPIPTGGYDLVSIVSHSGRSADGGHYVAWGVRDNAAAVKAAEIAAADLTLSLQERKAKKSKVNPLEWIEMNDESVFLHTPGDNPVFNDTDFLSGGLADQQIAYLCLYKKSMV